MELTKQDKKHIEERVDKLTFRLVDEANEYARLYEIEYYQAIIRKCQERICVINELIDPYNRLESDMQGRSETLYISQVLDKLTNFAQRNDILIILMAHPTKLPKNQDGAIQVPTLYDISGSANFFNKADFGLVVHRDRAENTVEVHIQKVKFRHLGECGMALFKYNINNGRYADYTPNTEPVWDNTNHLIEAFKQKEHDAYEAAHFDWSDLGSVDECPY